MPLATLPFPSSSQLPSRLVLREAPDHPSFCVHPTVALVPQQYASQDPSKGSQARTGGTSAHEHMHCATLHMTVRYQERDELKEKVLLARTVAAQP